MGTRVLIVEDSPLVSSALRILLEAGGYDVTVAGTAGAAVQLGLLAPPQVVLLDLALPDADGLSVLVELKARGVNPAVTLAMTGSDDDATRERCIAAGCDDVLIKPVPARALMRIIAERVA